jgi:acyl-CoA synthetase (NDP forming)
MVLDVFYPRSVAVIGASLRQNSIGYVIARQLLRRFKGEVFLVNPGYKAGSIEGREVVFYSSVLEIGDEVDLAVVATPYRVVPQVVEELGRKGVKAAVIVSGGFAEVGNEELEREVVEVARKYGVRVLGPNCVGIYNGFNGLDTMFLPEERALRPPAGPIAFISQSGAVMTAALDWAAAQGIGVGLAVNLGNKADVDEAEVLEYLAEADDIKAVAIYLEGFRRRGEARRFLEAAKKASAKKPVIAYKAGRSPAAQRAVKSHTAALAGSYEMYRALFRQAGIIEADDLYELFEIAQAFALSPQPEGGRVLVVTTSGGMGVQVVDALTSLGLETPPLPEDVKKRLREAVPSFASLENPVDLTGSATAEQIEAVLDAALGRYDMAVVVAFAHPRA